MDVSKNPWRFTSADVSANPVTTLRLRVNFVRVQGMTDAAHKVILRDASGREVWRAESTGADFSDESNPLHGPAEFWDGLVIHQLDSGTVEIEFM